MKNISKLLTILCVFVVSFISAADPTVPIPQPAGQGGNGTGAASPIDMYVYGLAVAAILMITFFAKKYKTQKI